VHDAAGDVGTVGGPPGDGVVDRGDGQPGLHPIGWGVAGAIAESPGHVGCAGRQRQHAALGAGGDVLSRISGGAGELAAGADGKADPDPLESIAVYRLEQPLTCSAER
jgi:hypothetical protein